MTVINPRRQGRRPARRNLSPDFFQPGESPAGERAGTPPSSHKLGRPMAVHMPRAYRDGRVERLRTVGSRAVQPPPDLGPVTSNLPLLPPASEIPFQAIVSRAGDLIRRYKYFASLAEATWLQLENMERTSPLEMARFGSAQDSHRAADRAVDSAEVGEAVVEPHP